MENMHVQRTVCSLKMSWRRRKIREMLAKWVNQKRLLLRQQGEEKQADRWGSHGQSDRVCMQADQTKASTSYLVADKSCRAWIRGRHFCTASALFSPIAPGEREKKTDKAPPPLSPVITEQRERVALGLSASQLMRLCCLNNHFLYKIDALTAALACTRPHSVTVQWKGASMSHASSPILSYPPCAMTTYWDDSQAMRDNWIHITIR